MFIINRFCCSQKNQAQTPHKNITIKTISIQDKIDSNSIACPEQINPYLQNESLPRSVSNYSVADDSSINLDSLSIVNEVPSLMQFSSSSIKSQPELVDYKKKARLDKLWQSGSFVNYDKNSSLKSLDFIGIDIRQWQIKNVLKFIEKIGLKKYQNVFYENKIKGKDLITLTEDQIRNDLKIEKDDQKLLTTYIKFLQERNKKVKSQKKITQKSKVALKLNNFHSLSTNSSVNKNLLRFIQNPIIQESDEELSGLDSGQIKKDNFATQEFYSPHLKELFSN